MRLLFKSFVVSFFLIVLSCSMVGAMGRSSYAIRIRAGSPLAMTEVPGGGSTGGFLLVLQPSDQLDSGRVIVRNVGVGGTTKWETGLVIPLHSDQWIASASVSGVPGGYILAVNRNSIDTGAPSGRETYGQETFFTKLNQTGGIEWQKIVGGEGSDAANIGSLVSTSTGGFIAAGGVYVSGDTPRMTVASFDDAGKLMWGKSYSVPLVSTSSKAVVVTSQNAMSCTYGIGSGAAIFKMDLQGNILWSKRIHASGLHFVSATNSGKEFLLLFNHAGTHSIYVTRLDSEGQLISNHGYRDPSSGDIHGLTIVGRRFVGISANNGFIAKFNSTGEISSMHGIEGITAPAMFQGQELLTGLGTGESMLFKLQGMSVPNCKIFQPINLTDATSITVKVSNFKASSTDWNPRLRQKTVQTFLPTAKTDSKVCSYFPN
jgi:hypothetical protein